MRDRSNRMSKTGHRTNRHIAEKAARAPVSARRTAEHGAQWARQERLLDDALEQTFPASDPLSSLRTTR
jgi:hypothetical protein